MQEQYPILQGLEPELWHQLRDPVFAQGIMELNPDMDLDVDVPDLNRTLF